LADWQIKFHPDFFRDLESLSKNELSVFAKKKDKIKKQPLRLKHLSGGDNCYRERVTKGIRVVYCIENDTIWFLTIGKHDPAYDAYRNRLQSLHP
jgi:mRNA-degrading endonuclease RelE of RelBE toxin-antitoxin system